jgi:hypothetical protein
LRARSISRRVWVLLMVLCEFRTRFSALDSGAHLPLVRPISVRVSININNGPRIVNP